MENNEDKASDVGQGANRGLTRERFAEIVAEIQKEGGKLTYAAVTNRTGASRSTFGPWLRELKATQRVTLPSVIYPDALVRGLKAYADAALADLRSACDALLADANEQVDSVEFELKASERRGADLAASLGKACKEREALAGGNDQLRLELQFARTETAAERSARATSETQAAQLLGEREALYRQFQGFEHQLVEAQKRNDATMAQLRNSELEHAALQVQYDHILTDMSRIRGEDAMNALYGRKASSGSPLG
jgi:chromosome segregation ATPase